MALRTDRTRHRNRRGLTGLGAALILSLTAACWANQSQWNRDTQTDTLTRKSGESEAEALYRAGHTCMEVHERDECAIEYFERLVEKNPRERALVGDAMFRLVKLYRRDGRDDAARLLMREFWDKGMGHPNRGALPYAARWFPNDLELLTSVDAARFRKSQLSRELEADTVLEIFSCDPETVARLEAQREARREQKRQKRLQEGKPAEPEPDDSKRAAREDERRAKRARRPDPVFEDGGCATAVALDATDRLQWVRMTTALNTDDPARSAGLYAIPDLDARLAAATQAGTLEALADGSYLLPGLVHGLPNPDKPDPDTPDESKAAAASAPPPGDTAPRKAQRVRVAKVDQDQLLLAGDEVMDEVLANIEARNETLDADLVALSRKVPSDVTFFTILTPAAMQRSFDELGTIAALLPRPEGMLFSAVSYDYAGMFVRIPTSNPLKAAALLALIKSILSSSEQERANDPEPSAGERAIAGMDLSQTTDGKALQMTTVLTPEDIDAIFKDD